MNKKWINVKGRVNLAGVQYSDYQLVCGGLKAGTVVKLVGEPNNIYDTKAVRVEYKGLKLGYLPRYSIQQSEVWNAHKRGHKVIAIITAFNKTNPTWCMITIQVMKSERANKPFSIPSEIQF